MNKIITDKLIEEKLKEKGLSMYDQVDDSLKKLQDYYEFELTDSYNRTPDYSIFAESTADGYEVWVATSGDGRNICINEDVYYYDSDLHDALVDAIKDELSPIYLDDEDADFVDCAIEELYQELYDEKYQETKSELEDQGYKYADEKE